MNWLCISFSSFGEELISVVFKRFFGIYHITTRSILDKNTEQKESNLFFFNSHGDQELLSLYTYQLIDCTLFFSPHFQLNTISFHLHRIYMCNTVINFERQFCFFLPFETRETSTKKQRRRKKIKQFTRRWSAVNWGDSSCKMLAKPPVCVYIVLCCAVLCTTSPIYIQFVVATMNDRCRFKINKRQMKQQQQQQQNTHTNIERIAHTQQVGNKKIKQKQIHQVWILYNAQQVY